MSGSNPETTAAQLQRLENELKRLRHDFGMRIHAIVHLAGIHPDRVHARVAEQEAVAGGPPANDG